MKLIGCGCARRVYKLNDNSVIKVPYNEYGVRQAEEEYEVYQVKKYQPYLAEIFDYNRSTGEITMELLEDCGFLLKQKAIQDNIFPSYILNLIDSEVLQVGIDRSGNIKIFDYASGHVPSEMAKSYSTEMKEELNKFALRRFKGIK